MITWLTPAGSLGVITERVLQDIPLEATSNHGPVTFSLISGSLPRGLRLSSTVTHDSTPYVVNISGSPTEVKKFTVSRFVIRADDGIDIEDRTFSLSVDGADIPEWVTREGFLNVGPAEAYFVLDNSRVEFQLEATDTDLIAGDTLEYFLVPMGGELPPGLSLSRTGLISGFTDPIFALEYNGIPNGGYDTAPLDVIPLDYVEAKSNGFDTYFYDNVTYDYNESSRVPRRLSRIYNFVVAISDGLNSVNRLFKIFVVTEEFLQADNSIVQVDTNLFQADSASDRKPLWITESDLGRFRANNYVTIFLDVYDPPTLSGTITYFLLPTNPDGSSSILPPGMALDNITGEIAGRVPYQSAVTKNYQFTMMAVNFPATLSSLSYNLRGTWNGFTAYAVNDAVRYLGFIYVCTKANRSQTPADGSEYWYRGVATADKTFTVDIIGEIESAVTWLTDSDRGTIKPNQPSQLYIAAKSLLYGGRIAYDFISGSLPPGLTFLSTGAIQGKVKQFADDAGPGLTRLFDGAGAPPPPPNADGRDHNPLRPLVNSVAQPFGRYGTARYLDGIYTMVPGVNPRTISNIVVAGHGEDPDPTGFSGWLYAWGQFLTHDLEFAREGTINIDVIVPAGDTGLTPGSHIPVRRNAVALGTGPGTTVPATTINETTGWLDSSVVYGITYPPGVPQGPTAFANPVDLREGGQQATTGKLLTSLNGLYPPKNISGRYFVGDPRGTENPDLLSCHVLMIRDHNWHVDRISAVHPDVAGERLYQRAKSLVIAEMQKITYDEWLPKIVGPIPAWTSFNPNIDATTKIEFSAAALRFGHSIVSNALDRIDETGNVTESLLLRDAFFLTPAEFERNGGADGFMRKLAADVSNKLDVHIVDDLRNLLDDPPAALDLAATNIQRGRDLGLGTLNQTRIALGLVPYEQWNQITSDPALQAALSTAYGDIQNVDLWIGGLAEDRVTGAMVGQTFRTILVDQFTRLRDGDQYWWENRPWAPEDRALLDQTTLSGLILRNTNTVRMQPDAFVAVERTDLYNGASLLASPIIVPDPPLPSFNITFDGDNTTFDKKFTFTIRARDAANFAESLKTFYITVVADNAKTFANLFVKAFQTKSKRLEWYNFITDATIFTPGDLYRYGDPNFGIQTELKMLVYAGIESAEAVTYVQAMSRNHYRKRLLFGDLKVAEGKDPVTQETIYEVIYVNIVDDFEKNGVSVKSTVELDNNINSKVLISYDSIKIDSDIPLVSDSDHQRVFPNSIKNMRKRIQSIGDRDREFLPLWMRSIQDMTAYESGFAKALVLCYTNPGKSAGVLAKIKAKNFDFKTIDFTADRYLIDIIDGQIEDKYLAFPQRGEKLP
jgi:hypothetical protein